MQPLQTVRFQYKVHQNKQTVDLSTPANLPLWQLIKDFVQPATGATYLRHPDVGGLPGTDMGLNCTCLGRLPAQG